MEKVFLGRSNLQVSRLGYGCMGLSHAYGEATEEGIGIRTIEEAYNLGYNFFDTAEIYGTPDNPFANEELVGKAVHKFREKVIIATKFGIRFDTESSLVPYPIVTDSRPETIKQSVLGSLDRLQTDHIDLYYQHRIDPNVDPEDVAEVMCELIKEGKIRYWGISEANEDYIRRAHAVCPVTAIENRYSMMYRDYEKLFPTLEELGIGFVAFSPLANGLLTNQYNKDTVFESNKDYRKSMPQFTPEAFKKNKYLLDLIQKTAIKNNATPAQISLAWMLCKKKWIVPIPGTRDFNRLAENARSVDIKLTNNDVKILDDALDSMNMSQVFGMK